jgi:hypothetical protein
MKQLGFDEIDRVPACERGAEEEAGMKKPKMMKPRPNLNRKPPPFLVCN